MLEKEKSPKRNEKCPCGSGKKAKRCCLPHMKTMLSIPKHLRARFVAEQIINT